MPEPQRPGEQGSSSARIPLVVLGALMVIAVILGIATGAINERTFNRPASSPSDPITLP